MALPLLQQRSLLLRPRCLKWVPLVLHSLKRNHNRDHASFKLGRREIVGYGFNGSPSYVDRVDYPMPAIRFQEPCAEICALREKELCDWRKLSMDEKKILYRYSFCQTFAEMQAPTGDWKFAVGAALWATAVGVYLSILNYYILFGPMPVTFDENRRTAQLRRIIALEVNPIEGIASKWDYDANRWKK